MKWITHEVVAVGTAYLLGMPPEALGGVFLGSILPDMLDQCVAKALIFRNLAFNAIHRGPTHWFGWWLALLMAGVLQLYSPSLTQQITLFVTGVGFGGLAHIILDMCTVSGVPVVPWSKKPSVSLKLCKTGSAREYAFLLATVLAFGLFARQDILELVAKVKKYAP